MTDVKICGLMPGDDLSFTSEPAVCHVGFIFVEKSRRYITPVQAREMVNGLHETCAPVGVFVNSPRTEILRIVRSTGIRHVQLHGDEPPELCSDLKTEGLTVWKALRVPDDHEGLQRLPGLMEQYATATNAILLDAAPPKGVDSTVSGGHGRAFGWDVLKQVLQDGQRPDAVIRAWVAGGVNPSNVSTLLSTLSPVGIDVSSGVEVNGRKSIDRIQALIEAVNQYDRAVHVS